MRMHKESGHERRDRLGVAPTLAFALALTTTMLPACAELEPMVDPEQVSDLQLTIDALKTSLRDTQRTIAELRGEAEARRTELAEAQVARARLQGRVREAERRLTEARQVVELQREELKASRAERERFAATSRQLQNQMRLLQKQLQSRTAQEDAEAAPAKTSHRPATRIPVVPSRPPVVREAAVRRAVPVMPLRADRHAPEPSRDQVLPLENQALQAIPVKAGDTIWSIARRYRVDVRELRALNNVTNNHIQPGQALWLPDPHPVPGEAERSPHASRPE
jgi:nucleoid-associated protein YgaU